MTARLFSAACIVAAGCGRFDFDALHDGGGPCIPSNHDEDGDGIDDACDVCPHIADDQRDSDGDGVGDACDPHVSMPIDHLTFFDPFTTARPEWLAVNVTPQYTGDSIILDGLGGADVGFGLLEAPPRVVYAIGGHIDADDASNGRQIALERRLPMGTFYCEHYDPTPSTFSLTYSADGSNFFHINDAVANDLVAGDITTSMTVDYPTVTCKTSWPAAASTISGDVPITPDQSDHLYIGVRFLTLRLDYFVEIRSD